MTENIDLFIQSSIRIRGDVVTYIDPFRVEGRPGDADIILITHDHHDHYSPEDIQKVMKEDVVIVAPEKMRKAVERDFGRSAEVAVVVSGKSYEIRGLSFKTVPAYNIMKPFHPRLSGWVGYLIETAEGTVYVAGDTDATKELKSVKCDVAMVPIGGTFTMNPREAALAVNEMKPRTVIPTHYGSIVGSREDAQEFKKLVADGIETDIRI